MNTCVLYDINQTVANLIINPYYPYRVKEQRAMVPMSK